MSVRRHTDGCAKTQALRMLELEGGKDVRVVGIRRCVSGRWGDVESVPSQSLGEYVATVECSCGAPEKPGARPGGRCPCGAPILADTDECRTPLCYDCVADIRGVGL